jgi:hypothetical protein
MKPRCRPAQEIEQLFAGWRAELATCRKFPPAASVSLTLATDIDLLGVFMFVLRSNQRAGFALVALAVVATVAGGCHNTGSKDSPQPTTTTNLLLCNSLPNPGPNNPQWRQCEGLS